MKLPLAAALVMVPFAAHAATYEFDTIENGKTTDKAHIVLAPKALCMTQAANPANGTMVFVQDPPTIYYSRAGKVEKIDQARIDQLKSQMQAALGPNSDLQKKMEEALAKVPPAQREMMRKQMEKYMGGAAAMPKAGNHQMAARTYKTTGRMMTKYGYKATEYTVMAGEHKVGTAYLAPLSAIPQGPALMARMQKLMDFAKSMMSQFGMQNAMTGNFMGLPDGYFPVGGQDFDENGNAKSETKLVTASKDTPESCKAPE